MVRSLQPRVVNKLDLDTPLQAEAAARNSVLPSQPGLSQLAGAGQAAEFTRWLASELQHGLTVSPRTIVNARKPRHGTRPAPIMAIPERVSYRAIVQQIFPQAQPPSRSREDYLAFVRGPVQYVLQKTQGLRRLGLLLHDDEIRYVVKSDLAAFYEYIDHGILGRLLLGRSSDVHLLEWLTDFLAELEGRGYGLPQMFDASDWLSELYGQLIQDQLLRRGYLVWRFNDDFRIGVPTFGDGLEAIEALTEEARSVGMIINEHKTVSPKFSTYAMDTFGLHSIDEEIPADEEDQVETAVADYTEMFGDSDEATSLLLQAVRGEDGWDLTHVPLEEVAPLRCALWSVIRVADARALPALLPLAIYVPSLTPVLCRYAEALAGEHETDVAAAVDLVLDRVSLGGWQRLWFNRLLRNAGLLIEQSPGDTAARIAFANACIGHTRHPATRAEAVLALAPTGLIPVQDIVQNLVTQPRALASWYVAAAAEAAVNDRDEKVLDGLRGSEPHYAMLLDAMR